MRIVDVEGYEYEQLFSESGGRGLPLRPTPTTLLSH